MQIVIFLLLWLSLSLIVILIVMYLLAVWYKLLQWNPAYLFLALLWSLMLSRSIKLLKSGYLGLMITGWFGVLREARGYLRLSFTSEDYKGHRGGRTGPDSRSKEGMKMGVLLGFLSFSYVCFPFSYVFSLFPMVFYGFSFGFLRFLVSSESFFFF